MAKLSSKKAVKKAVAKIVPVIPRRVEHPYILSLQLRNEHYESAGETALEALRNMKKPQRMMVKGILTIQRGYKKKELLLFPLKLRRFFFPSAQKYLSKRLEYLVQ